MKLAISPVPKFNSGTLATDMLAVLKGAFGSQHQGWHSDRSHLDATEINLFLGYFKVRERLESKLEEKC